MKVPAVRVRPSDIPLLERRARALASGRAEMVEEVCRLRLVAFRLDGRPCAVEAQAVERAVSRLGRVVAVPLASRGERLVAFVEELPLPIADLAECVGRPRPPEVLAHAPAIVLSVQAGRVAVAVEGPLELLEEAVAERSVSEDAGEEPDAPRLVARLAGGASLLEADWLIGWAGRKVRP